MVELYVSLITKKLRTLDQVPALLREDVRKMLIDLGLEKLIN